MANSNEDPYGLNKLTIPELNKVIADLVKQNNELSDAKSDYVKSVGDILKENCAKIKNAILARSAAQVAEADQANEMSVKDFLKQN